MKNNYHNLSLSGACHIFANTIAQQLNTRVWIIVHENPLWDCDEYTMLTQNTDKSIIHAFVELPDHSLLDTSGILLDENKQPIYTSVDYHSQKIINSILPTIHHSNKNDDPITVISFTSDEFNEIIHDQPEVYNMTPIHELFSTKELHYYKKWVLDKLKR